MDLLLDNLFDGYICDDDDRERAAIYMIESWRNINNLLDKEIFCDVTLLTNDEKSIKAHKIILSSSSTYFENLIADNGNEYKLDVTYFALKTVLYFLYNGFIETESIDVVENISEIFDAIDIMDFNDLGYYMRDKIRNIMKYYRKRGLKIYEKLRERFKTKTDKYSIMNEVERAIGNYIKEYFKKKNFKKIISVDTMYNILNIHVYEYPDGFERCKMSEMCNMLIEWITEYPNDAKRLIPAIRWSYVSSEMLKELKDNPIIKESGHDIIELSKK
ncbi:kelch-like protein [Cotia virus SPAn232]|uniref:Kelch-like protein n=2 Tax=Cotia virus TaxID=39444 RepID=H6TAE0_9POXV|nr:kelch-like protein [Cotia virus SPAn232]YP_005296360.1 kelch-like protein [Cotia virus SPAn232]AIT70629.1 kelch-like protein [Cotia virus]AFB76904.1 kelch-like protein [Cotia virus SPAn232]AFB76974.1 kelch-like protein [Cotia virus SPAn232]AIT70787.1 kelch-like protein [Cotia virus]